MDLMKIQSKLVTSIVSKIVASQIKNAIGMGVDLSFDKAEVNVGEEDTQIQLSGVTLTCKNANWQRMVAQKFHII